LPNIGDGGTDIVLYNYQMTGSYNQFLFWSEF
jgi:hypothetical protein